MGVLYPDGLNFQSSKPLNRLLITIHVIHVKPTPRYEYLSILSISKTGLTRPPPSDLRPDRALRHSGTSALGHYTSRNKYYRCQQCFLYVTQRWFTLCCTIPKVIDNNINSDPPFFSIRNPSIVYFSAGSRAPGHSGTRALGHSGTTLPETNIIVANNVFCT